LNALQHVKLNLMGRQQQRQRTTVQQDIIKAAGTLGWRVLPTAVLLPPQQQ
jgi:hypothetical protein